MWLNAKRSTVTIGLIVALIVALGVICYLVMSKSTPEEPPVMLRPPPSMPRPLPPQSQKPAVVLFYAEWCGHSKQMMPAWKEATQILSQEGYPIIEKEPSKDMDEIQSQNVQGFPTIRVYPQGYPSANFVKYQGDRTAQSIVNFVRSGGKSQ